MVINLRHEHDATTGSKVTFVVPTRVLRPCLLGRASAQDGPMTTRRTTRHSHLVDLPTRLIELDPYLVDDTTITLDEWRHQDDEPNEVVRLHQHHDALLVA